MMTPPARDTTHRCPCGCGGQVARHQLACKPGWFRLPPDLRTFVNEAYRSRRRDPGAHLAAVREAIEWYRDNPRPT